MGTDEMDINYIDNGDWEDFMEKNPKIYESQESAESDSRPAKRVRPKNQTSEEKVLWEEESRFLRNQKARKTRARKKAEKEV